MRTTYGNLKISIFALLLCLSSAYSQHTQTIANVKTHSYKEIEARYRSAGTDTLKSAIYAAAYLQKARENHDAEKMAKGYEYLYECNYKSDLGLVYIDSLIAISKNLTTETYPALGYILKAEHYSYKRNFIAALDNHVIAYKYAQKTNNKDFIYEIKFNIGLLKKRLGYYDESFKILKDCKQYFKENNYNTAYLTSLFALSDYYVRKEKLDSASYTNNLGYKESSLPENSKMRNYFVLEEGVVQYHKKKYQASIDSISKVLPIIIANNDRANEAMIYYYLGRDYIGLGRKEKAIPYFIKVDSIFSIVEELHPDTRKGYEILIDYYDSKKDIKKQLYYIERLLRLDSVLNTSYRHLSKKIIVEYDTPLLLSQKEKIITDLNKKDKLSLFKIGGLLFSVVVLSGFVFFYYKRQKQYRINFEKLLEVKDHHKDETVKIDKVPNPTVSLGLQQNVIDTILAKLHQFEKDQLFLKNDCTVAKVAKDFETNSTYLSKVINSYKGQNFSAYLNELRIDYTIDKIKNDPKFRRYSVNAIAEEVGYNNTESFSKAFFKKAGIYPSYFINNLKSDSV